MCFGDVDGHPICFLLFSVLVGVKNWCGWEKMGELEMVKRGVMGEM